MGLFTKFLAGGLGFAMGGPIGAIIGVVLAALFDSTVSVQEYETRSQTRGRSTVQGDFRVSLLVLMAAVMKADGKVVKSELDTVKGFLRETFGEASALEALQMLKAMLEQNIAVEPVARQIGASLNYSQRMQLLHMLYTVAFADGEENSAEHAVLYTIAMNMGISEADRRSIEAMFAKTSVSTSWAYTVLEIEESVSDDEVKKAYRRMAMKYHPDKVNNLGDDVKQAATEKFRKVNDAYEHIKDIRNMK